MSRLESGDDYVTCEECGHPLERHGLHGCDYLVEDGCGCQTRWTKAEVMRLRRAAGLPGAFKSWNF